MTDATFDVETRRRERHRVLEKRVDFLEADSAGLRIALALALQCATATTGCEPDDLLAVIEPVVGVVQERRRAFRRVRNQLPSLLGPTGPVEGERVAA